FLADTAMFVILTLVSANVVRVLSAMAHSYSEVTAASTIWTQLAKSSAARAVGSIGRKVCKQI
ncbi:MAG: hypothetical protein RIA65_09360, partial [Woeseia sp.]